MIACQLQFHNSNLVKQFRGQDKKIIWKKDFISRRKFVFPRTATNAIPQHGFDVIKQALTFDLFAPAVCFTQECQQQADQAFLIALSIPVIVAVIVIAYALRPLDKEVEEREELFQDPETGVIFEAKEGALPERDRRGELAFKAIRYTPWPVEEGYEGERVRIAVGKCDQPQLRTFVFPKILPQPSQIILTTLERPLGIIFEEQKIAKRVVVTELVENGNADQALKIAKIGGGGLGNVAMTGDVLRATTCTNIVYPTGALLFGARMPERHIVVFGADGATWPEAMTAFKKGLKQDGQVTLVLERALPVNEKTGELLIK
eukprot:TRINITY_DN4889_c0_g1_i11.p1 TRINITY_DN4889_c0_g1~~TRINITY_DN4889_c0_g1_i11.p1  ORF type:complete len:331 (+),score=48.29 TRINITY_DN4889_c0_g1_i11:41-994(+)